MNILRKKGSDPFYFMDNVEYNLADVRVVILIGPLDFGRCSLASRLSSSMWPILGKAAVRSVVEQLSGQGIKKITICSKEHTANLHQVLDDIGEIDIEIVRDDLPAGTAGSLRNALKPGSDELVVVMPASMAMVPDIKNILAEHSKGGSEMTVIFNKDENARDGLGDCAEIYVCEPTVAEFIPKEGYCDIKETLIAELVRKGKTVHPATLNSRPGVFRNVPGYLNAMDIYLKKCLTQEDGPVSVDERYSSGQVWIGENVDIDESVKIYGTAVIMDGAQIEAGTVLLGPVVIGKDCWVGEDCVVSNSVLWTNSAVRAGSKLDKAVIGHNAEILSHSNVQGGRGVKENIKAESFAGDKFGYYWKWMAELAAVAIAFVWSYWTTIIELKGIWLQSDEYSAGMLVPFLGGYVLWSRRRELRNFSIRPVWAGVIGLILAQVVRLAGLYFYYGSAERLSLVLTIISLVLLVCGWRLAVKVGGVLLFLFLMLPLPNRINNTFSFALQDWATRSAVWLLEMVGYIVKREGNIIEIGGTRVAVAEACNGLRMITAFFVIAGWLALIVRRKCWEKTVVILSALPIAILCNTIRLAITAIAFTYISGTEWAGVFHDYGGYAMMPLALAIIMGELWIMAHIFVDSEKEKTDKRDIVSRKVSQ